MKIINPYAENLKRLTAGLYEKSKAATAKAKELTEAIASRKATTQGSIMFDDKLVTVLNTDEGAVHLDGVSTNSTLKIIRVRDASLLDEDAMKVLAEMAEANDYQIWMSDRTALDEWQEIMIAAKSPNDILKDLPMKRVEGETHRFKIRNPLPRNIWRRALD